MASVEKSLFQEDERGLHAHVVLPVLCSIFKDLNVTLSGKKGQNMTLLECCGTLTLCEVFLIVIF